MSRIWPCLVLAALAMSAALLFPCAGVYAGQAEEPSDPALLPWALRDHYTFTYPAVSLLYGVENGQWSIALENGDEVIERANASVRLADGSVLDLSRARTIDSGRERFDSDMGGGRHIWTEVLLDGGLRTRHSLYIHDSGQFFTVRVRVTNTGENPVEIAGIHPVALGPGCLKNLSGTMVSAVRRIGLRGNYPVYDRSVGPTLAFFQDRQRDVMLALGVFPNGVGLSSVRMEPYSGTWIGDVTCAFDPPLRLDPNQSIDADPVFLSFSVPKPSTIDMYYSWAQSALPRPQYERPFPWGWVTVNEGASASDLERVAEKWRQAGVGHALVPGDWEMRPGSMQGASPRYPREIRRLAQSLAALGVTPGLTVDPLATTQGQAPWAAASADGQQWLDLTHPSGREQALRQMRELVASGFGFFAVQRSHIPDSVLRVFNVTRAQADALALGVMAEAAGALPVVPTPATTLGTNLDEWLEATGCTSRMREYGVRSAAIRFDAGGVRSLDDALLAAITLYGGPVELLGEPSNDLARQLVAALPRRGMLVWPLDAAERSPRLWQLTPIGKQSDNRSMVVMAFPGAPEWSVADLDMDDKDRVQLWRADGNGYTRMADTAIPAANELTVYGVTQAAAKPIVLGASHGSEFVIHDLDDLLWDPAQGMLSGSFAPRGQGGATAHIVLPPSWALNSGRAGEERLRPSGDGSVVPIRLAAGRNTLFELKLKRD